MGESPEGARLPRRRVLRALAAAPAALAACAAGRAVAPAPAGAAAEAPPPAGTARDAAPAVVAAVRGFRLPPDAEPAFVFRAAGTRSGDPR